MKCKLHRRYKGIHKPRISCVSCWWVYFFGGNSVVATNNMVYNSIEFED